jgi:hypothetical protein
MKPQKKIFINRFIIIGALFFAAILYFYLFIFMNSLTFNKTLQLTPRANLTIIAGAQLSTVDVNSLYLSLTPTPKPTMQGNDGFILGSYIQISGTGGNGLRIRNSPGIESGTNFIANESEVFQVIGGPVSLDDFIWVQLTTPYDQSRQGWAATNYMISIQQ